MTPESFERGVVDFKEAITSAAEERNYEIPLKQYEYVRKDGSTFWGELKMKMLRDSNNNLVGVQGTLRDVTERKEAEKKLDEMMNEVVTINEKLGVVGKLQGMMQETSFLLSPTTFIWLNRNWPPIMVA